MRATNGIALACPLPLTDWHCKFGPNAQGQQQLAAATFILTLTLTLTMDSVQTLQDSWPGGGRQAWLTINSATLHCTALNEL
jgi:hypothetical protein